MRDMKRTMSVFGSVLLLCASCSVNVEDSDSADAVVTNDEGTESDTHQASGQEACELYIACVRGCGVPR